MFRFFKGRVIIYYCLGYSVFVGNDRCGFEVGVDLNSFVRNVGYV